MRFSSLKQFRSQLTSWWSHAIEQSAQTEGRPARLAAQLPYELSAAEEQCLKDWLNTVDSQACASMPVDSNPEWRVEAN
jgi:hypothetical protein